MPDLASRITAELQLLVGKPLIDFGRAANMAWIGFGGRRKKVNRRGEELEVPEISLHVQCCWRLVDENSILFAHDDLLRPADPSIPLEDFDWDKQESVLDSKSMAWLEKISGREPRVVGGEGDRYGGFQICLEEGHAIEAFPCDSERGEHSEQWRLFGHAPEERHFVVTGYGIERIDQPQAE